MRLRTAAFFFLAVFLSALMAGGDAMAASSVCRSLQAQLASVSKKGSSRYANAAAKQRAELQKAEARARRDGCTGIGGLFRGNNAGCGALNKTIAGMRSNLVKLEARAGGGNDAERRKILAAIDRNNCNGRSGSDLPGVSVRDAKLFERDARRKLAPPLGERGDPANRNVVTIAPATGGGSYRTMCVRTCDGYYFPISFSANASEFHRDQLVCEAMCPGTEVRLFYHDAMSQESEDMISATADVPYTMMPNAFRYREANAPADPSCVCQRPRGFEIVAGKTGGDIETTEEEAKPQEIVPLPVARLDPVIDPLTEANIRGGFDAEAERQLLSGAAAATGSYSDKVDVRVVGPVFLPDPEAVEAPPAPDRTEVR